MPSQWDRKAHFFKLSCCLSQECLNKRAGERKGNYNSREEEEDKKGGGHSSFAQDDKPVFLLSLSGPSTCTHFKKLQLKPHSQESLSTTAIHTVETPLLHLILPTDKTCTSHSYPERRKTGESNLAGYGLSVIWQYSLTEPPPSTSTSTTVSPPLGYQMCLAQFGMRHSQTNILPRGATLESPCWVSKKNILSFI